MSCSPFDLKDYFLQELPDSERRQVEAHVKTCQPCRDELDQLGFTRAALMTLREEEIPQRIAFVSDKIFEPSPLRRWLTGFWGSAARLGFASAAMLSTALVVYSLRPAAAPVQIVREVAAPTVSAADIQAKIDAAVAVVQARDTAKTEEILAKVAREQERLDWQMVALQMMEKKQNNARIVASGYGPPPEPDAPKDRIQ